MTKPSGGLGELRELLQTIKKENPPTESLEGTWASVEEILSSWDAHLGAALVSAQRIDEALSRVFLGRSFSDTGKAREIRSIFEEIPRES